MRSVISPQQYKAIVAVYNALTDWPCDEFKGESGKKHYTLDYTVAQSRRSSKALEKLEAAFSDFFRGPEE